MKLRKFFLSFAACTFLFLSSAHAAQNSSAGIVNFTTCITESKYGQQEQASFEDVQNKMSSIMKDLEGQLQEIAGKFQDPDFIDSISPEAEQEMKARFQTINEELSRYQNQYYQVMNQANMKLVQLMSQHVSDAAESIAKKQKLSVILNKEACFYYDTKQDITAAVVSEMDKSFEKTAKDQKVTAATEQPSEQALN